MIRHLHLTSFKAFEDASISLQPLTVLIGANGTGKSTVLQAIELLQGLVVGDIKSHLGRHEWSYDDLPHLRSATKRFGVSVDLALDVAGVETPLTWELELHTRRRPGIAAERVNTGEGLVLQRETRKMERFDELSGEWESIEQTLTQSWIAAVDPERDAERFPALAAIGAWARGIRGYFFLDPTRLRAPSRGEAAEIGPSGQNLATFLGWLQRRDPAAFERVHDRVRRHYPRLRAIHPVRSRYGWTQLEITEKWGREEARFGARQVSDGLLRLLAIACMHEHPVRPRVLLLDEVENGLHPHLLGGMMGMLRSFVEEGQGASQVIVTTHSPLTVNSCDSLDEVVLVHRRRSGHAVATPFSELEDIDALRTHFDLGELWYNVGEERLLRKEGGR